MHTQKHLWMKVAVAVAFVATIIVNYLANALPINGKGTGELSDMYPSLFTPAGYTFSIWGVIYLALAAYVAYRLGAFRGAKNAETEETLARIDWLFLATSAANIGWILAWHYLQVGLSVVVMVALLVSLILLTRVLHARPLSKRDMGFLLVPFSLYFGWITVATIANVSAFLVHIGWDGFGISPVIWTVVVLFVGVAIGLTTTVRDRCGAYGLVLVWAYTGILMKHLSGSGFAGKYPAIITATAICIALLAIGVIYAATKRVTAKA